MLTMTEAYSLKELGLIIAAECKKDGLHLAEQTIETLAKGAYMGLKKWGKESASLSENKYDDLVSPFYDRLDVFVIPQIEKIDLDGSGT